jgi:putative endonuclease
MERGGWVYIMTNKPRGVLYTGVTADIAKRVHQHKTGGGSQFCKRYNLDKLAYAERHATIEGAISREKAVKAWKRAWKIELIEHANPLWDDLSSGLL